MLICLLLKRLDIARAGYGRVKLVKMLAFGTASSDVSNDSFTYMEIFKTAFTIRKPNIAPKRMSNLMLVEQMPAVCLWRKASMIAVFT